MSNRFHNKFHRHNHHTRPTDRNGLYPDSAYDPVASPEAPFEGEFYVDGNLTTLSSVSALGHISGTDGLFHGDVTVEGNLSVRGNTTQLDTFVYVTSALDITNVGTGPALKVTQEGNQPIAHFIDSNGDDIIFADNGYVGLGTFNPNEKLTVIGGISATGNITAEQNVYVQKNLLVQENAINYGNSYLSGDSFNEGNLLVGPNNLFVDSSSQNVGIGTLIPNQKLTVIGNISATGDAFVDGNITAGTLLQGVTDDVIVHNNNVLQTRQINSQTWDTQAEFLSAQNLIANFVPMYGGPNTLVLSQIEYNGAQTIINGDTTVTGNLTSLGSAYFANTLFTTTSSLSIVNTGPGPALYVYQAAGNYDVASFYDGDGVEVLHVGNSNPNGLGKVGINSSFPNKELTVIGSISATEVIYVSGGNSNQWNSSFSNVQTNSANFENWQNTFTNFSTQSANNLSVYSTVQSNSATTWNYQGTDLKELSANWQNTFTNFSTQSANNLSVYSNVRSNSATWNVPVDTGVRGLTGNYNSVYSTVQSNSANWQNTYSTVQTSSASWVGGGGVSGNYLSLSGGTLTGNLIGTNAIFTSSVSSVSLSGTHYGDGSNLTNLIDTGVRGLSANWQNTFTNFSTQSANNLSVYSTVQSNSASWVNPFSTGVVQTFTTPLTASGKFLVATINGVQQAIRLWDTP